MRIPILREYDVRFNVLLVGRIFAAMGWAVSMPFLAIYMSEALGVSTLIVGLTYTVSAIFGAASQMISGQFVDRLGRRFIMTFSMGIRIAIFAAMALAVQLSLGFLVLAVLMALSSVTGNMWHPAANAMVTDIVPSSKRIEAFAISRVAGNLGWSIGPALGGVSAQFISYSVTFLITAICAAVTFILTLMFIQESKPEQPIERFNIRAIADLRRDRNFLAYSIVTFLFSIIAFQLIAPFSIYSQKYTSITEAQLGALYMLNGLLVVFLQFPVSRALSNQRFTVLMSAAALLNCAGYFSVAFMTTIWPLVGAMTIITLAEIISAPAALTLVGNMSPISKRGQYMGFYGLFESLGGAFGPLIGGAAIDAFPGQPVMIWSIPCLFGLASAAGFVFLGHRLSEKTDTGKP